MSILRPLDGGAFLPASDLELGFHEAMIGLYQDTKRECGYNGTRFLQLVATEGGLRAAKALLHAPGYSEGFTALWEHGRLDLSTEALVLHEPWLQLFTDEELATARKRLAEHGFAP